MSIGTHTLGAAFLALTLTAGCYPKPKAVIWLANDATAYCTSIGGQPDSRRSANGRQFGFCRLPNDRICEMWALLRKGQCVAPAGGKGWELYPY